LSHGAQRQPARNRAWAEIGSRRRNGEDGFPTRTKTDRAALFRSALVLSRERCGTRAKTRARSSPAGRLPLRPTDAARAGSGLALLLASRDFAPAAGYCAPAPPGLRNTISHAADAPL